MNKFKFLQWPVYKDSRDLFVIILGIVKKLPKEFRFELGSQLIRSCSSISLNIAEGNGKTSDKELNRFLEISLGSLYETLACVDILRSSNLINQEEFDIIYNKLDSISNQLGGFKKRL